MNYLPVLIIIAIVLLSGPSAAQQYFDGPLRICMLRQAMVDRLSDLGESLRGIGLRSEGGLSELWVKESDDTPTWTVIVTFPNGTSCLVGSGTHYEVTQPTTIPEGKPL